MIQNHVVTIGDVVYNSKAEMCEAHGVSKELYDARISRGFLFTNTLLGY